MIPVAILAGGRGERMKPETDSCPKPMLKIAGRPLLEHQIEWLKRWGATEVFLCVGWKAEVVSACFGDGSRWGMRFRYSVESSPRGTAGAIKDIGDWGGGDLLVVYGDLFVDMDCRKLVEFHRARSGLATLVTWKTDHPQDSDLVRVDGDRVAGLYRSKEAKLGELALAAIWVVRRPLMDLVPADKPSDFGRDVFPRALAGGGVIRSYLSSETMEDVGTPERRARFLERWGKK